MDSKQTGANEMQATYIIQSVKTKEMIECHDELSKEWGEDKVKTHNDLYPNDQWEMIVEWL